MNFLQLSLEIMKICIQTGTCTGNLHWNLDLIEIQDESHHIYHAY